MHYINCDFFFIQDSEEEEVEEDSGVVEGEGEEEGSEVVGDSGGGNSIDNLPNIDSGRVHCMLRIVMFSTDVMLADDARHIGWLMMCSYIVE